MAELARLLVIEDDDTLRESLAASARAATESLQPVVQQAMAGIAAESSRLHEGVNAAVQAQLEGLSVRFSATTATVAETWTRALTRHEQGSEQLLQGLGESLVAFNSGFDQRAGQLLASVQAAQTEAQSLRAQAEQQQQVALTAALERMALDLRNQWQQAGEQTLAQQRTVLQALQDTATRLTQHSSEQTDRSLDGVARLIAQTEALVDARTASEAAWTQQHAQRMIGIRRAKGLHRCLRGWQSAIVSGPRGKHAKPRFVITQIRLTRDSERRCSTQSTSTYSPSVSGVVKNARPRFSSVSCSMKCWR